jgi:putative PIN family toxin of toxin-antitoxin system
MCEGRALRVVVDTNVWVSGLILPESTPGRVLAAAQRGDFELVVSWSLVEEIADVLSRPKLERYEISEGLIASLLQFVAPALPTIELEVELRDPDDAHVVEAAISGAADAIVTGDRGLLEDDDLRTWLAERGVGLHTPASLLDELV